MVLSFVLSLILCGVAVYTVIPDLFLHRLGIGSWKRQYTDGVALTFDDGPDAKITPLVLEVLGRYDVKATFFLLGSKVAEHSELIKDMLAQGHQIGLHSQHHHYAWFLSPWATWREWEEGVANLERITQRPVEMIRPPWGTFNLVTWWWVIKRKKRIVLWNLEGHDWKGDRSPEQISQRILKRAREGGIIVLHDSGGEVGAPENSLLALDYLCQHLINDCKLPLVALEFPNWGVWRRLVFSLWQKWESIFARLYRIEKIDAKNLLRLSKIQYKGPNLYNQDGLLLAKEGDIVVELHLDNMRLQGKGTDIQKIGLKALRQIRESLPALANFVRDNPAYLGIQVFMGLTLLNRGVKGLGFNVQEISQTWFTRGVGALQRMIMLVYHPAGKTTMRKHFEGQPKLVWISREELLSRWLTKLDLKD